MVDIQLIAATESDIPILTEFLSDLFSIEADFTPDPERQANALSLMMQNPEHATVYKVVVDGETAGMVALHFAISTADGGWSGRIEDVYLKPEFRRRGIGSRVMDAFLEVAAARGPARLTLAADKDNGPALDFYRSCGFFEMNLTSFRLYLPHK